MEKQSVKMQFNKEKNTTTNQSGDWGGVDFNIVNVDGLVQATGGNQSCQCIQGVSFDDSSKFNEERAPRPFGCSGVGGMASTALRYPVCPVRVLLHSYEPGWVSDGT